MTAVVFVAIAIAALLYGQHRVTLARRARIVAAFRRAEQATQPRPPWVAVLPPADGPVVREPVAGVFLPAPWPRTALQRGAVVCDPNGVILHGRDLAHLSDVARQCAVSGWQ